METDKSKINGSIFNFFDFDIRELPDNSFEKEPVETNSSNQEITTFRKRLPQKMCGLFDTIEIIVIRENKNIFFSTCDLGAINMDLLKKLFDDLFLIFGVDDRNKGKFTTNDIVEFYSSDMYALFGRNWQDSNKFDYPVAVSRDNDELSFGVWGIQKSNS